MKSQPPLPPRPVLLSLFAGMAVVLAALLMRGSGQAQSGGSNSIYLPVAIRNFSPPAPASSFEAIDQAVDSGELDAETALVYKTYANFGDPRLPAAYQSGEVGGQAGLFMLEVVKAYPTLSPANQALLKPFFIPPFQSGSWMSAGSNLAGASLTADSSWAYVPAAGGKVRVWYKTANSEHRRKAGVVANAVTSDIWPKLTALMARSPKPDSAGVQNIVVYDHYRPSWNSTFVPFSGAAGYAVPQTCDSSASVIYINANMPDSTGVRSQGMQSGLIETTAHEFMHALQFSFPLAVNPCEEYNWLGEATAAWAEDYVYPDHDFEWRVAKYYLDNANLPIQDTSNYHQYGVYLLVYYFTEKYGSPEPVRQAWVAAGTKDSLEVFKSLGGLEATQVAALWNKEPFDTFFKDRDTLPYQIKPRKDVVLSAAGGFAEYAMDDILLPGGIYAYHYTVDPSVRTISILNGVTHKISPAPYQGSEGDTAYEQTEVEEETKRGALAITLVKFESEDEPWMFVNSPRVDLCQDWKKQRVSEILVFVANQNFSDRNHYVQSLDKSTRILTSSVPCMGLHGTTNYSTSNDGVTESITASNLEFETFSYFPDMPPIVPIISPGISMRLTGGTATWKVTGTDSYGCTHSGSQTFTLTKDSNPSHLSLYFDLLPGSRRYLGYEGNVSLDSPSPQVTTTVSCQGKAPQYFTQDLGDFLVLYDDGPVKPGGTISGNKARTEGSIVTRWEWSFTPVSK